MNIFMRTMRQLALYTLLLVIAATGCTRTPYTSSVSKIRLTAESIATVKGKSLSEGKYTVGNDIVTLKNSDIAFKADILKGKSPTVTFGSKKDVTQALSEGDNQVMVNITGSADFEAVSFTITVHRTPAPPPPAPTPKPDQNKQPDKEQKTPPSQSPATKITLTQDDVASVKGQMSTTGKYTVANMVGSLVGDDVVFKSGKLHGKKPTLTFGDGKTTSQPLTVGSNTVKINITGNADFEAASFDITVERATALPPSPPPATKIILTKDDIASVKGQGIIDGKYTVTNEIASLAASDVVFKSNKLNDKTPTVTFGTEKSTSQTLTEGDNNVTVNITEDANFKEASFAITVQRETPATPPSPPPPPPSVEKITLTQDDIVSVKGKTLISGKYTVTNEITALNAADIMFKPEKVHDKTPTLTFGTEKGASQTLTEGDNNVTIHVTANEHFEAASFTITVQRESTATPPPPPPAPKTTLTVSDIQTILGKTAESDGKTFKIGNVQEISVSDIMFDDSVVHGKTPKMILWYLKGGYDKRSSEHNKGKLSLQDKKINLHIDITTDEYFESVTLDVVLEREGGSGSTPQPPSPPPASGKIRLTAADVATVLGFTPDIDGSFKIGSDKLSMERDDVQFKSSSLKGKDAPHIELWYDIGSGKVETSFFSPKLNFPRLPEGKELELWIEIPKKKKNADFEKTSFTITLKRN